MSLINDALKKAQKQRTGETPSLASMPSVGGETPHRIAKRSKPAGFDTLVIRASVGAGVLLVVVVGGYFGFRSDAEAKRPAISDQPTASVSPVPPTVPVAQNPAPTSSLPAQSPQVSAPVPAPAFTLPIAQVPAPSAQPPTPGSQVSVPAAEPQASRPSPQASVPSPAPTGSDPRVSPFSPPSASPQASRPTPQTSAAQTSAVPPKLEPRAIQYIENIKVAGIMARPTDSKVLMNDRVYRVGSLVEAEMGLKLVEITTNSLTFEDERGGRYTRTF